MRLRWSKIETECFFIGQRKMMQQTEYVQIRKTGERLYLQSGNSCSLKYKRALLLWMEVSYWGGKQKMVFFSITDCFKLKYKALLSSRIKVFWWHEVYWPKSISSGLLLLWFSSKLNSGLFFVIHLNKIDLFLTRHFQINLPYGKTFLSLILNCDWVTLGGSAYPSQQFCGLQKYSGKRKLGEYMRKRFKA